MINILGTNYYDIKEIATAFKVDVQTVYRWRQDGKITAIRHGREYHVSQKEFDRIEKEGI